MDERMSSVDRDAESVGVLADDVERDIENVGEVALTGHRVVDDVLAQCHGLDQLSIEEQIEVLTTACDTLSSVLQTSAMLEQAPIPGMVHRSGSDDNGGGRRSEERDHG